MLGKVRTLLECADGTLSKKWSGLGEWTGLDTPKTVMTTRAPAVLNIATRYIQSHKQQSTATSCMKRNWAGFGIISHPR